MNFLAHSTNVPPELSGKAMYGLEVTVIGVLIVFAVLALIMLVIYLFQAIFGGSLKTKKNTLRPVEKAVPPSKSSQPPVSKGEKKEELVAAIAAATAVAQEELIVVLAAAVAAQEGCDVASSRYRIRSFRRIL